MEDVNSSSPEGTPITSRRNSNSLVAVVEESDLDDTPVATSAVSYSFIIFYYN